jgi:transcriptional regulator with XRE-family HTH domain
MEDQAEERGANPIDVHVGDRIRRRRRALAISQDKLAEQLGLTFQQVQKYERGANRVSASKLYQIARALQASIPYFFEGLPDPVQPQGVAESPPAPFVHDMPLTPEERELSALLSRIESKRVRRKLLELVRSLAEDLADDAD